MLTAAHRGTVHHRPSVKDDDIQLCSSEHVNKLIIKIVAKFIRSIVKRLDDINSPRSLFAINKDSVSPLPKFFESCLRKQIIKNKLYEQILSAN